MNVSGQVLCHLASGDTARPPTAGTSIRVAVFEPGNATTPTLEVETKAFNWQQGARAHWVDDEHFVLNDFDVVKKIYCARVFSARNGLEQAKYDRPAQDSFGEKFFLSINYQRLMSLRPDYGYRNLAALTNSALRDLTNDGIWRVDYDSGDASLIYSLAQICAQEPKQQFAESLHKVNHLMISPTGVWFIFLHRYFVRGRRHDRLMLGATSGQELRVLVDHGLSSHCFWVDNVTVLGYLRGDDGRVGYHLVDIQSGVTTPFDALGLDQFGDGHPHVVGDSFVTDTYPDKARMQHLVLCGLSNRSVRELGEFHHGFEFTGESRCDLHPRLSDGGRTVFFDSVFSGRRQMYRMDIRGSDDLDK